MIERLSYRLDRFLHLHPVLQLALVLGATFVLALVFAAIAAVYGHEHAGSLGDGLWWAVTRMLDGGTVAGERGLASRLLGLAVTLTGLVALAVLTGAFASSFADRIRVIRQGRIPIFERGHVVLLGWNARGAVILRELAASGLRATVAVVADQERDLLEERAREAVEGLRHRLRIVVKRGDPTTTAAVRAVSATAAHVIAVLPEGGAEGDLPWAGPRADRAALRSLLAVRRVLGGRRVPIVVEASCRAGEEMIRLLAGEEQIIAVDARDFGARVLVHAVQQPGAFDVVRQILSLRGCSLHLHPAAGLAGCRFDQVHATVADGVLIGLVRGGAVLLSPAGGEAIAPEDQLLVIADHASRPRHDASLPGIPEGALPPPSEVPPIRSLHILVARHKPELAAMLEFLGPVGAARMTVLVPPADVAAVRRDLAGAHPGGAGVEVIGCDPLDADAVARALAMDPDVALLLAPDVAPAESADADSDQIITLLHLRRLGRGRPRPLHVVLELRSPETRRLVVTDPDVDFVLSGEIVGMLLAQEIHAVLEGPGDGRRGDVVRRALDDVAAAVRLRPLADYAAGDPRPSFALIAAAARARGEVALGVEREGAAALLLPERHLCFDVEGTRAVVLRPPEPPAATAAARPPAAA